MNEILTLDNKLESSILTTNSPLMFVIELYLSPQPKYLQMAMVPHFLAFITFASLNSIKFSSFLTSLFCECIDIETNINKKRFKKYFIVLK